MPEPDSPTTPRVCPSRTVIDTPSTRLHVPDGAAQEAVLDREPDLQVLGCDDGPSRGVEARGGMPLGSASSSMRV